MPIVPFTNIDLSKDSIILRCPFQQCNTRILSYSSNYKTVDIKNCPPLIKATTESNQPQPSLPQSTFYLIDDVWSFDNIGVSRPADDLNTVCSVLDDNTEISLERFLICSECDKGPLGFAGIPKNQSSDHKNLKYFLNVESIMYEYRE